MKNYIYYSMVALLISLLLGACSDDDTNAAYKETAQKEVPAWQVDWSNDQQRPEWTEPDASLYENWTILKVQIEDELNPYVSEDDLMALFVNGEIRSLAKPAINLHGSPMTSGKFLMKVYGNETGTETINMTLQYYSHALKNIFTLSANISLDSDETIGIDEDYIPLFTLGSAKYPVTKLVKAETLLMKVGITPASGNKVAAFVGEECRGTVSLSSTGNTSLIIYGRSDGESVTLNYYNAEKSLLYTIPNAVKM